MSYPTWKQMGTDAPGTVYLDWVEDGVRCLILRGGSALYAYVGIPEKHPLASRHYGDVDLHVHGGLTFSGYGDGKTRPTGYYWYGWDYGHWNDGSFFYDDPAYGRIFKDHHAQEHRWTVQEVEAEIKGAIPEFRELMCMAETGVDRP